MRAIKTKLQLNNKQKTLCVQHAGVARHAWNWALNICIEKILNKEYTPTAIDLHKLLVATVKVENKWYYESSKCAPQQKLRDLEKAFNKFWKKHKDNVGKPFKQKYKKKFLNQFYKGHIQNLSIIHEIGFPNYKKKGTYDSFFLEGSITVDKNKIKVPRIGWIKTHEELSSKIEPKSVHISCTAGDWFISFIIDRNDIQPEHKKFIKEVGVDLGIITLATLSDGITFEKNTKYKQQRRKIARLSRKLSRQRLSKEKDNRKENGQNYNKTKIKLAKLHADLSNLRMDTTHKLTTYLANNHSKITVEGLNVSGMMKNKRLSNAIANGNFYEFVRQLEYKCAQNGTKLIVADKWFASSKICSCCKHKQNMPLKKRIFNCERCGIKLGRDYNAAINLLQYEEYPTELDRIKLADSYAASACGDTKVQDESLVSVIEARTEHYTFN